MKVKIMMNNILLKNNNLIKLTAPYEAVAREFLSKNRDEYSVEENCEKVYEYIKEKKTLSLIDIMTEFDLDPIVAKAIINKLAFEKKILIRG